MELLRSRNICSSLLRRVSVARAPWPWSLVLLFAVPLIAIEVNILRVVGIGVGYEMGYGWGIKDWMGWGAMGFGTVQVAGLGWLAARR